jgi:predicted transcriptional regulator
MCKYAEQVCKSTAVIRCQWGIGMSENILDLDEIEKRRRLAGLTRRSVYEAAGIASTTWMRIMRGDHSPNLTTLRKLSEAVERLETAAGAAE